MGHPGGGIIVIIVFSIVGNLKFEKISDTEDIISFDFTCPFCSKKYTVKKI